MKVCNAIPWPVKDKEKEEDYTKEGLVYKDEMFEEYEQEYGTPWNTHGNPTEKA